MYTFSLPCFFRHKTFKGDSKTNRKFVFYKLAVKLRKLQVNIRLNSKTALAVLPVPVLAETIYTKNRAEPRETADMRTYNVVCWFSNLLITLNKN